MLRSMYDTYIIKRTQGNTMSDRSEILLRAAYDLLTRADENGSNIMDTLTHYDDTDCDGFCLTEDIGAHLGLPKDIEPIALTGESGIIFADDNLELDL